MRSILLLSFLIFLSGCSHDLYHPNKSSYLDFDQGKIYYETYGAGSTIIAIHEGPGLSHDYFLPHMLKLAENHRVVFYDLRG